MAFPTSLASLEYSPDRDRPAYRGVLADEIELLSARAGIRLFVPDEPGLDAGEISEPGISRLKDRVRLMAEDDALPSFRIHKSVGSTHYVVWNRKAAHRLTAVTRGTRLRDTVEIRNFLAHGREVDELLIAYTESAGGHPASLFEMVTTLVRSLFASGWDSAKVGASTLVQNTPEEAARARSLALRDELLARNWPTSAQVARLLGSQAANAAQYAAKKRAEGKLFGVWSIKDNTYVHPEFQFDEHHQVRNELPALLAALSTMSGMSDAEDKGGWRRAFWLYGPTAELSERALGTGMDETPRSAAEAFATNPEAVIALAHKDATRDLNAEW